MPRRPKQEEPRPKSKPFNNPFQTVKLKTDPPTAPAAPVRAAPPKPRPAPRADDDFALFLQAMDGVEAIPDRRPPPPPPPTPPVPLPRVITDDAEALMQLAELVSGEGSFDLSDSEEYVQGSAPDLDKRVVRALKRGEYAVQARLDLHGMTRTEAKEAVEVFLARSRREGKRCVLLVHGRGLNSKDQIPVLKESVQGWLTHGRLARMVLAFATARPHDGGAGAVYVLLRKSR
ncbi:MAG: Smr/MutS family protein [Myxococcota bacterium]|nr:Smr/MutS family protein [Myxococcota bacterium]